MRPHPIPSSTADVSSGALAHFLRARRATTSATGSAGDRGHRRVPGLRRSELAERAGVSVDYIARLEQGRQRHASVQVLDALASALALPPADRAHLHMIGSGAPSSPHASAAIAPSTVRLIRTLGTTPAVLLGRGTAVLMMNPAARLLFGDLTGLPHDERYAVAWMLGSAEAPLLHGDWGEACRQMVGILHHDADAADGDPDLVRLVDRLVSTNALFRSLWGEHHVSSRLAERKEMHHPQAGTLDLSVEAVTVIDAPEQHLYVLMPRWGTSASERFAELAASTR